MMDWLLEPLRHPFNQRAILAALLIGFTNGYASAFVVLKKSALKVGSLSHALLPGIAVAILVAGLHDWSAFLGSLFAALLIGLGSLAVSRGSRLDHDSALAILYTAAFSGGIILLRRIGVTQEMEEWLFGNIMGLRDGDLWTNFWISFGALGVLTALHRPLLMTLFDAEVAATLGVPVRALNYLLLAVLIVVLISSLQAVGCMLALGLLVTPAATVYLLTDSTRAMFWGGSLLGGLASAFAVLAGWWLDIEQGPAIVLVLGAVFVIAFLFSPKYGLLGLSKERVKHFFRSGIGAAVAWVACSLLMAAVISPWVYQGGKQLAAAADSGSLPAALEWLGSACGRAKFGRFFDRSLLFSALVLLPLLLRRVRASNAASGVLPAGRLLPGPWKRAAAQVLTGLAIAAGLLWALGFALDAAGAYDLKEAPLAAGKILSKVMVPAVVVALLEEWLFRGLLLGLWLRFARPAVACAGTALMFATLHFLSPPSGSMITDPAHPLAGFQLLGKILLHFTDPLFFVTDFATLLAVGLILAWARVRTGALWFSIGLHAGWIMAFKSFNMIYQDVPDSPLRPWGVGESLRSGALPLLALCVTAAVCHFALRPFSRASR